MCKWLEIFLFLTFKFYEFFNNADIQFTLVPMLYEPRFFYNTFLNTKLITLVYYRNDWIIRKKACVVYRLECSEIMWKIISFNESLLHRKKNNMCVDLYRSIFRLKPIKSRKNINFLRLQE